MSAFGKTLLAQFDVEDLLDLAEMLRAVGVRLEIASEASIVDHPERLLNTAAAARLADCSVETIRRNIRDGKLEAGSSGRDYKITRSALDAWLHGDRRGQPGEQAAAPPRRNVSRRRKTSTMTEALKQLEQPLPRGSLRQRTAEAA